jgi:hypothetical protein
MRIALALLLLVRGEAVRAGEVLHPVAPDMRPSVARAFTATVVVEVDVSADGVVQDAHAVKRSFFLDVLARAAACEWRFAPASAGKHQLTFEFERVIGGELSYVDIQYEEPKTLRAVIHVSDVGRLERINGKVVDEICDVHGTVMALALVPVTYGLPANLFRDSDPDAWRREHAWDAYSDATSRLFPNTRYSASGGCTVSPTNGKKCTTANTAAMRIARGSPRMRRSRGSSTSSVAHRLRNLLRRHARRERANHLPVAIEQIHVQRVVDRVAAQFVARAEALHHRVDLRA